MKLSNVVDGLRRNWSDRHWYATSFNAVVPAYYYREVAANDGEYVVERDWDTLTILDGCRFDLFEAVYEGMAGECALEGDLEQVTSRGSASTEFIDENYRGRDLRDVVYVTANPFVSQLSEETFHHVDHVWQSDWDDDLETVTPETMVEHAIAAHERFPNKRLVVHCMQPHYPFVGDVRLEEDRGYVDAVAKSRGEATDDVKLVWERLRRGEVDAAAVWRAYRANLERAIDATSELVEAVPGKHVLTADHGNAFGERVGPFPTTAYGHDDYLHIPSLVEVPWLELPADERRTITHGDGETDADAYDDGAVEERLQALGYA